MDRPGLARTGSAVMTGTVRAGTGKEAVFDGARPEREGDLKTVEVSGIAPIPEDGRYGREWRMFTLRPLSSRVELRNLHRL